MQRDKRALACTQGTVCSINFHTLVCCVFIRGMQKHGVIRTACEFPYKITVANIVAYVTRNSLPSLKLHDCSTNEWNGQYIRRLGLYVAVNNLELIGMDFTRWCLFSLVSLHVSACLSRIFFILLRDLDS